MFMNKPASKPLKLFNQKMTAWFYKLITRAVFYEYVEFKIRLRWKKLVLVLRWNCLELA